MKQNEKRFKGLLLSLLTILPFLVGAQSFTNGNIAVFVAAANTSNTTGSIVEFSATGTGIVSRTIPDGNGNANGLRFSGSGSSTGYLANSNDGTLLSFNGANSNVTGATNVNTLNPRGIGAFNSAGTYSLPTTYTGVSGQQTRGSSTLNNTTWFIGDQNGFYSNGTTTPSPTGNIRSVKAFGGTVYAFTSSASLPPVGIISAATGGTYTALTGLPNGATSRQDFYLISSGSNGTSFDVLYVLDATSATAGTIFKYSLVSGSWVANGTYTTNFGGFGMAARKNGSGADLFVSSGTGATAANKVVRLNDVAGYNATINITTANNVDIYTAAAGTIIKGVAFAPIAPVVPTVSLSVNATTGTEAAQTVITLTATASAPVTGNQTVDVAVSGTGITAGDYTLSNTTITIPNGATTGTITFTIVDDVVVEVTETATLTISNPSSGITLGSPPSQNVDITDNDTPPPPTVSLSVSTNTGSEAAFTVVTATATAAAPVTGNQTVTLGVSGAGITAADYVLSSTTITILNGATTGTATFTVRNDAELEGTETATLTISSPSAGITLGTPTTQNVAITDNVCQPLVRKSTATSANGAEISAYDSASKRIYTVAGNAMEYYTLSNAGTLSTPTNMPYGFTAGANTILPNSVAIKNGIVAVGYAIVDPVTGAQQLGRVAFYDAATAAYLNQVTVGYLPDMILFNANGTKLFTANEGEPNSYGQGNSFDPEGSVSIIDISGGVGSATVQTADFTSFNGQETTLRAAGIRIFGPGANAAKDFEPEYIALSADESTAYITLQENNAVAVLNVASATITNILPLGLKDHNAASNGFDASDRDGPSASKIINIQNWPVKGMYMPDAIAQFNVGGTNYYITANEGDSRAYGTTLATGNEEIRVSDPAYVLDVNVFPNAATLKQDANLGRLQLSRATGDIDNDGDFDEIHALGARSFSIWNSSFTQVFDSKDQLEQISATQNPIGFNSDGLGTAANFDTRSDNKGPEPEGVAVGMVDGVQYAFVGSERTGDIFVYDITNPAAPVFKQYLDNPIDLQVEGVLFIPANQSPTGKALVVVSAEISRTVTVYEFSLITNSLATVATTIVANQQNTTSYGDCVSLVAKVNQSGAAPISGSVTSKVWIEPTVPTFNTAPYVQRHYEITPAANATNATGTVTLYFTQAEFDNFNNDPASTLDLPTGAGDAAGINNLRVIKYAGTSNNGTGLPNSYTSSPVGINPNDANIIWNATFNRWEVTFDVTGFSAFFVQTNTAILPLSLLSFNAKAQGENTLVEWKSNNEINHSYYEVLYSIDGIAFSTAGQRNALVGTGEKNYTLTHSNAALLGSKLFYKLKMVSTTRVITYSNVVMVRFGKYAESITDVYPNPTNGIVTIRSNATIASFRIVNTKGSTILTQKATSSNNHLIDLTKKLDGIYILEIIYSDKTKQQFKIIKQ